MSLPGGTVTFLFTDIEGSTKRWEAQPEQMSAALARHDQILRSSIEEAGGHVFKTVGDAFYAAFATPLSALTAALSAQEALAAEFKVQGSKFQVGEDVEPGTLNLELRVRMALHTGMVEVRDGDYFGQPLNRVARLLSAGHGGQVLLSNSSYDLMRDVLPRGAAVKDLGEHRLKDLYRPEHIFQVTLPGLPDEFPPLKTLDARPNNLPLQPTPLIGREKELAAVEKLLAREDTRLVTLSGPGGTGKTRLALQVGAEALDSFRDGVWFVNLAPITDPKLVISTIAQELGVKEAGGTPLLETLKSYLREKELLLILDNFEQVVQAAPQVSDLLSAAPRLKVLATSRARLQVRGEKEHSVPPLSLPDAKHLPPLEQLSQYEAVRLFIERAQDVKSDFSVNNDNAPAVAEICARLDGLPLAIELAAARIKILPPQAMLSRLQNRLKVLTGGPRDLPSRQQTLRGAIEWSYDLLSPEEQRLLRRLAVFQGGRTLEAIEAVCNAEGDLGIEVLDGVQSLVDKSLLKEEEGVGGELRFVMLETIHEFAREKLEDSPEAPALHREHARHYLALAEEAERVLTGAGQGRWLARLEAEHDNMRAALRWARENKETELGLRLAGALGRFWNIRNHLSEGREQLTALLALDDGSSPRAATLGRQQEASSIRAKALRVAGGLAWNLGNYAETRLFLTECLEMSRQSGERTNVVFSLIHLGRVAQTEGDHTLTRSLFEESLATAIEAGDKWLIAFSLNHLAIEEFMVGDLTASRLLHEQSLAQFRETGDAWLTTIELVNLGAVAHRQGDDVGAAKFLTQAMEAARALSDQRIVAAAVSGFGAIAGTTGHPERGARLLAASLALREVIGFVMEPEDQAEFDRDLAIIRGQLDEETFARSLAEGRAMSMEQAIEYALQGTDEN